MNKNFYVVHLYFEFQIEIIILVLVKNPKILNPVNKGALENGCQQLSAAHKCNCSYYGLTFVTFRFNTMNKRPLWLQN